MQFQPFKMDSISNAVTLSANFHIHVSGGLARRETGKNPRGARVGDIWAATAISTLQ